MAEPLCLHRIGQVGAIAVAMLGGACAKPAAPPAITIAAAANLATVFPELGADFTARGGPPVVFSFAASATLANQLRAGAPFDGFAAASEEFTANVVAAGVCDGSTQFTYAHGELVVWRRTRPALTLTDLANPDITRIAIAHPDHAPFGRAAQQAFARAGIAAQLGPRLVLAENVRQALQMATTGNVDAAVIARNLVPADSGVWTPVDPGLHDPLAQTMVVCGGGSNRDGAVAFVEFLQSPAGQAHLEAHGLRVQP